MAWFREGGLAPRASKRKSRECVLCCEQTTNPIICAKHPTDSVYCDTCACQWWIQLHRELPACHECHKQMTISAMRAALCACDVNTGSSHVAQFDSHQIFLNGDPELPTEGWNRRVCVCHNPPCKGLVSANLKWIVFRSNFKVPKSQWNLPEMRYVELPGPTTRHPPICAHCLRPAPTTTIDVDTDCLYCLSGSHVQPQFATLQYYINPLAGAGNVWRMPPRSHQLSIDDLARHLFFLLEDPNLYVVCPIDGTTLEHGDACHELTCPTCNRVKLCFCCGRTELVGKTGAILDHYGVNAGQCTRYPRSYIWMVDNAQIMYPCTDTCANLHHRCDIESHQQWAAYYRWHRRTQWVVNFFYEIDTRFASYLYNLLLNHPAYHCNPFVGTWNNLSEL